MSHTAIYSEHASYFGSQQPFSSGTWIDQEWIAIGRFPLNQENQAIGRTWNEDQEGEWLHSWLVV